MGNASGDGDRPSLAREGDSEVDRRKREELQQPRRFQEDEELYEEKERNQNIIATKLDCPFSMVRKGSIPHRRTRLSQTAVVIFGTPLQYAATAQAESEFLPETADIFCYPISVYGTSHFSIRQLEEI